VQADSQNFSHTCINNTDPDPDDLASDDSTTATTSVPDDPLLAA
jgi:hypothetical protein